MKTLKNLIILLACAGSVCAMDTWQAGSSADGTKSAAAPLLEYNVSVITLDTNDRKREIIFAPEQIAQISRFGPMLTLERPTDRGNVDVSVYGMGGRVHVIDGKIVDLTTVCVEAPYLRYEILKLIPDLIDLDCRTFKIYLEGLTPKELCLFVLALDFLEMTRAYAWVHTYLLSQLIDDRTFFEQSLLNIENLRKIMQIIKIKRSIGPLNLLKTIRLKNNLVTTGHLTGNDLTLSHDGNFLAIGTTTQATSSGLETVYRTIDGKPVGSPVDGDCCDFTAGGSLLAVSNGISQQTTLYDSYNLAPAVPTISGIFHECSPDGILLATTGHEDGKEAHYLYHLHRSWISTKPLPSLINSERISSASRAIFNPDNSFVALYDDCTVSLCHVNDLTKPILVTDGHYAEFSSRGLLAISTYYGSSRIMVYNTNDLTKAIATVPGYEGIFSPDGSLLAATNSRDAKINIYHTSDLTQCVVTLTGNSCLFSPDGRLLAVGQVDKMRNPKDVKLYDTHNWKQIGHSMLGGLPRSCELLQAAKRVFSPDGSLLILSMASSYDSRRNIYYTHDGSLLMEGKFCLHVGSNDCDCIVAYYCNLLESNDIEFKRTLTMTNDEYLLTFAAIHQEADIDEAFWRTIFDHAQPQVQKFVREKTRKFAPK